MGAKEAVQEMKEALFVQKGMGNPPTSLPADYRRPMTLCEIVSRACLVECLNQTYHLQGPDPPDPDFQGSLDALDVLEVDAFPPASTSWLSPEQKKLLRHADRVARSTRCFGA